MNARMRMQTENVCACLSSLPTILLIGTCLCRGTGMHNLSSLSASHCKILSFAQLYGNSDAQHTGVTASWRHRWHTFFSRNETSIQRRDRHYDARAHNQHYAS